MTPAVVMRPIKARRLFSDSACVNQRFPSGPDGNLWFTQAESENNLLALIGRITTAGVITESPTPHTWNNPIGIAAGPDGNLWFTEGTLGGNIGRITTT